MVSINGLGKVINKTFQISDERHNLYHFVKWVPSNNNVVFHIAQTNPLLNLITNTYKIELNLKNPDDIRLLCRSSEYVGFEFYKTSLDGIGSVDKFIEVIKLTIQKYNKRI